MKQCPFCASSDVTVLINPHGTWKYVHCNNCGADGPADLGESGAQVKWDTRPLEIGTQWNMTEDRLPTEEYVDQIIVKSVWGNVSVLCWSIDCFYSEHHVKYEVSSIEKWMYLPKGE